MLGMLLAVVLLLAACTSSVSTSVIAVPSAPTTNADPAPIPVRSLQLQAILDQAYRALEEDRLMQPAANSAYGLFLQVLDIEPDNMDARRGMRLVTRRYMTLAEEAFQSGKRSQAEQLLSRALMISALPAEVDELRARFPQRAPAANERRLSSDLLAARGDAIKSQLAAVAEEARQADSRLLIVARSDSEGRWMYRQMRESVVGYRLRGNIEIASQPKIVLIDMPLQE
jgi:hypothetical protein